MNKKLQKVKETTQRTQERRGSIGNYTINKRTGRGHIKKRKRKEYQRETKGNEYQEERKETE